ncbi:hypothetical protein LVV53_22550, partial [Klebsiella pneumoniae]|nr:hypothetical protein [Klebsiella pneumoniae]
TVCVVGKIRDLILQLSKSSIYSTKPSPIPNCCHLKSVSAAHRQRENASFVSFLAYFLSGVTHPFSSSW